MMEFFSSRLVSHEFADRLREDLGNASICRFLVAYVNDAGVDAVGRHYLSKVLRHPDSFGVASLTCSCGYEPLLKLQKQVGHQQVRLKYFMDPMVKNAEGGEPDVPISLLHSKLVYLHLQETNSSVVYIGSHNWTKRALGTGAPRNAEASMRIEIPFENSHLNGDGNTVVHQVNRHLAAAFKNKACLTATTENEERFRQWYAVGCSKSPPSKLDEWTVIVAVRTLPNTDIDHHAWSGLRKNGIYLQVLDPDDGDRIRAANKQLLILAWRSLDDFHKSRQPIILKCHDSTQNPGPKSHIPSTNRAKSSIEDFRAVLFDQQQALGGKIMGSIPRQSQSHTRTGKHFYFYDLELPTERHTTAEVDGGLVIADQFRLEVDDVIFPSDMLESGVRLPKVWAPTTLAFASSEEDAKAEKPPGYWVREQDAEEILAVFRDEFGINLKNVKVKPVSKFDNARVGLRIAVHPLHDTYIAGTSDGQEEGFYGSIERGWLAAETDRNKIAEKRINQPLVQPRTQRVFTMKWEMLNQVWSAPPGSESS